MPLSPEGTLLSSSDKKKTIDELRFGTPSTIKNVDIWVLPRIMDVSRIDGICAATKKDAIRFLLEMDLPVPKTKCCPLNTVMAPNTPIMEVFADTVQSLRQENA